MSKCEKIRSNYIWNLKENKLGNKIEKL